MTEQKIARIAKAANVDIDTAREWLFADWDNGDEHAEWLEEAPVSEIAAWLEVVANQ